MRTRNRRLMPFAALLLGGTLAGHAVASAHPARRAAECVVPQLRGTPVAIAKQVLSDLGCRVGAITSHPSIDIAKNAVITTRPPAGTYEHDQTIRLLVSRGPDGGRRRVRTGTITGSGTNDDPYTAPCGDKVDGSCQVTFMEFSLPNFLNFQSIPAYRCPDSDPWLIKKDLSPGRIVPPGVLVEEIKGVVGTTIVGVSAKEGKTETRGTKTYAFDYATGTRTGFPNAAHAWSNDVKFRITLYCTSDLTKANLVNVRG